MSWMRSVLGEIFGLFVDDGSLALAILAWIGLVWFLLRRMHLPLPGGLILFAGLAGILVESVIRFSRHSAKQ